MTSLPSRVRFSNDSTPVASSSGGNPDQFNICQLQKSANTGAPSPAAQWALAGKEYNVTVSQDHADSLCQLLDLDSILADTPGRLERLRLGVRLAFTLLSLVNSPWAHQTLDTSHMVFTRSGDKPPSGPYLLSHTSKNIQQSSVSSRWHAKPSLLVLGVMLLELFHGERLEQQQFWPETLVGGTESDSSRLSGAHLWNIQARESLQEYLGRDAGGGLSDAIRKCVCFEFGHESEYGDWGLVYVVYREVIVLLENCCPL